MNTCKCLKICIFKNLCSILKVNTEKWNTGMNTRKLLNFSKSEHRKLAKTIKVNTGAKNSDKMSNIGPTRIFYKIRTLKEKRS